MLKSRACLIMLSLVSLLWGCGGGGLNLPNVVNPPNPTPNPPTGYRVTVTLNMNQVYEGEEVTCTAEVSPSVQQVINWKQEPSSPTGRFSPLSGAVVRWHAPLVERATSFSIVAYIVVQGRTYEGSSSVVVLDKSEPPQEPPRISIDWPKGETVVGAGVLLTIIGTVSQGSNPLKELVVLDSDGSLLQKWPISPGDFRVDLSNFGSPGRKVIRVRAVDSAGLYGEQTIAVTNDNSLLDEEAREFLKKYSCVAGTNTIRFGNLGTGPYTKPVRIYLIDEAANYRNLVEEACQFWQKYCGFSFEVYTIHMGDTAPLPAIAIIPKFNEDPGVVALTERGYANTYEVAEADISLYKGWLDWPQNTQTGALTHELGHALVTASEIEEFGSRCVLWPILTDYRDQVIPTIMQRAIHLVYSYPPGWQP